MKALTWLPLTAFLMAETAWADPHNVFGVFLTDEGNVRVEIIDCGDGSPCGYFRWFDDQEPPSANLTRRFSAQMGQPLLNALMLKGFSKRAADWRRGRVYDSDNNKIYAARLKRLADGSLQVKGCLGPFCQSQIWSEAKRS